MSCLFKPHMRGRQFVNHYEGEEKVSVNLEEQYEKIYRYCYFKVHRRELAEDITQETFLRFLESGSYLHRGKSLQYLYTIARNLCIDEWRRKPLEPLEEDMAFEADTEERLVLHLSVRAALARLCEEERELLLLRYVNETPVAVLCKLYGISRFALYRRLQQIKKRLREGLEKEGAL